MWDPTKNDFLLKMVRHDPEHKLTKHSWNFRPRSVNGTINQSCKRYWCRGSEVLRKKFWLLENESNSTGRNWRPAAHLVGLATLTNYDANKGSVKHRKLHTLRLYIARLLNWMVEERYQLNEALHIAGLSERWLPLLEKEPEKLKNYVANRVAKIR